FYRSRLMSQALSFVVHSQSAVQSLMYLHLSTYIAHSRRATQQLQTMSEEAYRVVGPHSTQILHTEDSIYVTPIGQRAIRCAICGLGCWHSEPLIEARQILHHHIVSLLCCARSR